MGDTTKWRDRALAVYPGGPVNHPAYGTVAYPMHERCWALMIRILDVGLIKNNLFLFTKVLYQRMKETKGANKFVIDEQQYWKQPGQKYYMNLALKDPAKYAEICEGEMKTLEGCLDYAFAPRDPFNIPELPGLLSDLEETHKKKGPKGNTKEVGKASRSSTSARVSSNSSTKAQEDKSMEATNTTLPSNGPPPIHLRRVPHKSPPPRLSL